MVASSLLDEALIVSHHKRMDSESGLRGSKKSSEIHTTEVPTLNESDISLVFSPSDQLHLALSGFLRPEVRGHHQFDLKTDPIKVLSVVGGDENGWRHCRYRGDNGELESDTDWLDDYRKKIKSIADARIPTAALPPSYEMLRDDSLSIELAFVPSLTVKRRIGHYGIRTVTEMDNQGEVVQLLRTLSARVTISDRKLIKTSDLQSASDHLLNMLEWDGEQSLRATSASKRMYITRPTVSDKRVF